MSVQSVLLRILNVLSRIVGVIWTLGGMLFFISAFVTPTNKVLHILVGVFLFVAGLAFVFVKGIDSNGIERFKLLAKRLGNGQ